MPQSVTTKSFHSKFKDWLDVTYPHGLLEDDWAVIMSEDTNHPYDPYPLEYPPMTEEGRAYAGNIARSPSPTGVNPEIYSFPADHPVDLTTNSTDNFNDTDTNTSEQHWQDY